MARIRYPDGTEVFTEEEVPTAPQGKFEARRQARRKAAEARKADGLTGRQRFERQTKSVVQGMWDYVTGDGDDFDRALKFAGLKDEEPEVSIVLPDDD